MKTILCLSALALVVGGVFAACSGPSASEVDATQDAQCVKWGAHRGTTDYIQCRATLMVNYQRQEKEDDNSAAAGVAIGMAASNMGRR